MTVAMVVMMMMKMVVVVIMILIIELELKHQVFLLSRRPTGTKLSADVAFLNTSCGGRGDRFGGLQATFCQRVGILELQSFGIASSTEQIVNKSL